MFRVLGVISLVVLAVCAGIAVFLYGHSDPSTGALDLDLANVKREVQLADDAFKKYEGGIIQALITVRREILKTTETMLQQKRTSLVRRVDLRFVASGEAVQSDQARANEIAEEITRAQSKLEADELAASKYGGGLIQAMALMTVETDRLALAQLQLALYGAKYGMALPIKFPSITTQESVKPKPQTPGVIVKDKDAF